MAWIRSRPFGGGDFRDVDLRNEDLRGFDLRRCDFSGANLSSSNLEGVDMSGAVFADASLRHANLRDARLDGAILRNTSMSSAVLDAASFKRAEISGMALHRLTELGAVRPPLLLGPSLGRGRRRTGLGLELSNADVLHARRKLRETKAVAEEVLLTDIGVIVRQTRKAKQVAPLLARSADLLEGLAAMATDPDYAIPGTVRSTILRGLSFVVPGGASEHPAERNFLDEAVMLQYLEEKLRHELFAYYKFQNYRHGMEQRPWTIATAARRDRRLKEIRDSLRQQARQQAARLSKRRD